MKNYNTGCVLDYKDFMRDKKEAARQFAEGNKDLENLLNFCFDNSIITKACCAGHHAKNELSLPYIAFSFCKKNELYLQSLLYYLKNSDYEFDYLKNENMNSFVAIYENKKFNFTHSTNLFKNILLILQKTNFEKNYFELLPLDLKNFYLFCLYCEMDDKLMVWSCNEYHSIRYTKSNETYYCNIITTNSRYKKYIKKCGTRQRNIDSFVIRHKKREVIGLKLQMLNAYISQDLSMCSINNSYKKVLIKK